MSAPSKRIDIRSNGTGYSVPAVERFWYKHMRENRIRISDRERAALEEARSSLFGTEDVPLGAVAGRLAVLEMQNE